MASMNAVTFCKGSWPQRRQRRFRTPYVRATSWGETYFYGVANSGGSYPRHLLDSSLSGPNWLSGGTAGPEGSVLCTALIVVVWLLCAAWLREIKYPARTNSMA